MPYRLRNAILLKVLLALVVTVPCSSALAGSGNDVLMDSLLAMAGVEPDLQEIFDSLGYDIDVVSDELGWEQFPAAGGSHTALLLVELSTSYYSASTGWHDAQDSTAKTQLFGPDSQANDSLTFTTLGADNVGFYFIPGISGGYTWYMNPTFNRDAFDHAKVFPTKVNPSEYIIAFEDLRGGGDQDFNDLIFLVRFVEDETPPVVTLPDDMSFDVCAEEITCFAIYGIAANPGDTLTIEMVQGPGDFPPVTKPSPVSATHCFRPAPESDVYTFVFKATDKQGLAGYDTLVVVYNVNQVPVLTVPDDFQTAVCSGEPVCFTASASDPDGDEIIFELLEGPGSIDPLTGEVCFVPGPDGSGDYVFVIRATDSCCVAKEEGCSEEPLCPPLCPFDSVVVSVGVNRDPSIVLISVDTISWCELGDSVCFSVQVDDPDVGQELTVEQLEGQEGELNLDEERFCFLPGGTGTYDFRFRVFDECGAADTAATQIVLFVNDAPFVSLPDDYSLSMCEPGEVCFPVTIEDDGSVDVLVGPVGTYDDGKVCFTASKDTTYCIWVRATDTCAVSDEDTLCISVTMNQPPMISLGPDTEEYLCEIGDTICFGYDASDPDGEDPVVQLYAGDGFVSDGEICFVPDAPGMYFFIVRAIDTCGVFRDDDIFVTVNFNSPPELYPHNDTTISICDPVQICLDNSAYDPDSADNLTFEAVSGIDVVFPETGTICFTPMTADVYELVLRVVDECGAFDQDTIEVEVVLNSPPSITGTDQQITIEYCEEIVDPGEQCFFGIEVSDPDMGDDLTVTMRSGPGTFYENELKTCFTPVTWDSVYEFCYRVTDVCGEYDEVCIDVAVTYADTCAGDTGVCLTVSVEDKEDCVHNSSTIIVNIFIDVEGPIGGFDLLIEYDVTAMTLLSAAPGPALAGWEYFTARYGPTGNCGGPCPDGLHRFVAIADINNGSPHPPPEALYPSGSIVQVTFRVTNDVNFGGMYFPIRFYWVDCGDNGFSSVGGDTLFIDKLITNHSGTIWDEFDEVNYPETNRLPNVGAPDSCADGAKVPPLRCVVFENGGICIIHPDSIDLRGDINLNDLAYEVADAVLFTNYFIWGIGVFTISQPGQIAATDINGDGATLTVGDLVYLIRVLTGDALPIGKLSPYADYVDLNVHRMGDEVRLLSESAAQIGAAYMVFDFDPGKVTPTRPILSEMASNMSLNYSIQDGTMKVLLYSYSTESVLAGANTLLTFETEGDGEIELVYSEFSDYYGNQLRVNEKTTVNLPDAFHLTQNYPNPFNPETEFELHMPQACDWNVEIFNVQGQVVSGSHGYAGPGIVKIRWDGSDFDGRRVASGIYFYRVTAGDFSETRKMLLVK